MANVADLVKEVRIALDNNMASTQLSGAGDKETLALDELVESKLVHAAQAVEMAAPLYMLTAKSSTNATKSAISDGYGKVTLPDDYMRLIAFRMSDWKRTISMPISDTDPLYAMQTSGMAGQRGCATRPVAALVSMGGKWTLEFWGSGSSATIGTLDYLDKPEISGTGTSKTINICEKLHGAIVHYAAYLVAVSMGDKELAELLLAASNAMIK